MSFTLPSNIDVLKNKNYTAAEPKIFRDMKGHILFFFCIIIFAMFAGVMAEHAYLKLSGELFFFTIVLLGFTMLLIKIYLDVTIAEYKKIHFKDHYRDNRAHYVKNELAPMMSSLLGKSFLLLKPNTYWLKKELRSIEFDKIVIEKNKTKQVLLCNLFLKENIVLEKGKISLEDLVQYVGEYRILELFENAGISINSPEKT